MTAWTDDAVIVREFLDDSPNSMIHQAHAALARLTALLETQEQERPSDQAAADALEQVGIYLSWVPPGHAHAARTAFATVEAALADLRTTHDTAIAERDEARRNADGMARAPYGEFEAMREARDEARAETTRLREGLADAVDVATWLTGLGPIPVESAWPEMRDRLNRARALLAGEPQTEKQTWTEDEEANARYLDRLP